MSIMDERKKLFKENKIGLEDKFDFKCTGCGKCCYNVDGITLTPYDLFHMAAELKISVEDIINNYCERGIGSDSKIPIVIIKRGKCPFLLDNKCRLNGNKPTICKLYPLGRGKTVGEITYCRNDVSCGGKNPNQTVKEWLETNGVTNANEEFTLIWYELIENIVRFIYGRKFSARELEAFQSTLIPLLYLCYDTKGYFHSQFLDRKYAIEEIMKKI